MATRAEIADYIVSQTQTAGAVYARKMFGEYGLYCNDKMVALLSDDQLYIKPTTAGRDYLGEVEEAPPYPGAKNYFLITEDKWDDTIWLTELLVLTARELPLPTKKKKPLGKTTNQTD